MEYIKIFYTLGIASVIVFGLMLIAGVILLVISVVKTTKGKKKIGGIIAGGVMTFFGLIAVFYGAALLLMGGYADAMATSSEASRIQRKITDAIKKDDEDGLAQLFAAKSYSGIEIEPEDAKELISYIEDYDISKYSIVGTSFHNDIKEVEYKYTLKSDDGDKCTVFFYCITKTSEKNSEYVGIQYIQLNQGKSVTEYGTKPKLN